MSLKLSVFIGKPTEGPIETEQIQAPFEVQVLGYDRKTTYYRLRDELGTELDVFKSQLHDKHLYVTCDRLTLPANWSGRFESVRREEARARRWRVYSNHIALFGRHRERILADPRLFFAQTPFKISSAYAVFPNSGPFILGIIAKAWIEHEETYVYPCEKCGGKRVVYSFAGSPLSGSGSYSVCCMNCDTHFYSKGCYFGTLRGPMLRIAEQYAGQSYSEAFTLTEAIAYLETLEP